MNNKETRYYDSFSDDFYQSGEKFSLEKDYEYLPEGIFEKIWSAVIYSLAFVISSIYCRVFLHVRFVGAKKLRENKGAFFLYGNHTQPIGDVFNPALACFPKRIYTVVSPANLHLPVIGRLLRPLGALPLPDTVSGMIKFSQAIEKRISDGHPVVIYPEAHLWDYYTDIRPFGEGAFAYASKLGVPVYCFTSTYQKRKLGKKPQITVYIDGPFVSECSTKREKARELRDMVYEQMKSRTKMNEVEYIHYIKR